MHLENFTFLAAKTSRSLIYLEKFKEKNIKLGSVLIIEHPDREFNLKDLNKKIGVIQRYSGMKEQKGFEEDIISLSKKVSNQVDIIKSDSVNHHSVIKKIELLSPEFTIYSGFGGQIVCPELLSKSRFLHAHAGWLPDYRGSTTSYYSLIDRNDCAVSVIELSPEIDKGDILIRKRYNPPKLGMDIDHLYDNQIRADLLAETLVNYSKNKSFEMIISQDQKDSTTYYVIHPVLKHLAILSIKE